MERSYLARSMELLRIDPAQAKELLLEGATHYSEQIVRIMNEAPDNDAGIVSFVMHRVAETIRSSFPIAEETERLLDNAVGFYGVVIKQEADNEETN